MSPHKFRQGDIYKKKLMRLGAAMRRYANDFNASHTNITSLSQEVLALEELSLSAFSLMKALKIAIKDAAVQNADSFGRARDNNLISITSEKPTSCIIHPFALDDDEGK